MNETQSENPQSSTRKSHSLVAAAALLNVSEKTLRRRIKAGEVEAEKVSLDGGGLAWRVYLKSNAGVRATDKVASVPEAQWTNATDVPEVVPEPQWTTFERESRVLDNAMDTQRPNVPEVSIARAGTATDSVPEPLAAPLQPPTRDESTLELLALLRERLTAADERERQMSLQIEAANRQAAEATAALREYLKVQARALPGPADEKTSSSTRSEAVVSRENAPQAPINAATAPKPQTTKKAAQIGSRGEGLRELRAIFKKLLGVR